MIDIQEEMFNKTEKIYVRDGASCAVTVSRGTDFHEIGYTVLYHERIKGTNDVIVAEVNIIETTDFSYDEPSKFQLIPICHFTI